MCSLLNEDQLQMSIKAYNNLYVYLTLSLPSLETGYVHADNLTVSEDSEQLWQNLVFAIESSMFIKIFLVGHNKSCLKNRPTPQYLQQHQRYCFVILLDHIYLKNF